LRGQIVWSIDNLITLAHSYASDGQNENASLLCAYTIQLASVFSFLYPRPQDVFMKLPVLLTDMAGTAQVVGSSKCLSAINQATQTYIAVADRGDDSSTAFTDGVLELLRNVESRKPPTSQKRIIGKIREYISSMVL